jgi:hypothetical protein
MALDGELESKRKVDYKKASNGLDVAQSNYNVNSRAPDFRDMRCRHRGIFECPALIDGKIVQSLGERYLKHGVQVYSAIPLDKSHN